MCLVCGGEKVSRDYANHVSRCAGCGHIIDPTLHVDEIGWSLPQLVWVVVLAAVLAWLASRV